MNRVFVGYDSREETAYKVCVASMKLHAQQPVLIEPLILTTLREQGMYRREHENRNGRLWDVISAAPMATEFAISRFLVPYICKYQGWALFCDVDFLWRADVNALFDLAKPEYAVMVVKHQYIPKDGPKMDGQQNQIYYRKNWSSLMLWNCGHPSNQGLTLRYVNKATGRALHGFEWLAEREIGALPFEWNWLDLEPRAVHMTHGTPDMPGHEHTAYADEWRAYL